MKAYAMDAEEPAVLAPLIECHIRKDKSLAKLELMRGTLLAAGGHCHERATRGVDLPQAHFGCARLRLYMGNAYAALNSYCMAIAGCHHPEMICDELEALTAIVQALGGSPGGDLMPASSPWLGYEWARRLMVVALAARAATEKQNTGCPAADAWIEAGKSVEPLLGALATPPSAGRSKFLEPVVIVAGGCSAEFGKDMVTRYGDLLGKAFEAFSGTIISGGTTAGVSKLVGGLKPASGRRLDRVAYLPNELPKGDDVSEAYVPRPSPGEGYNPAGVLRAWADILSQKILPAKVRLLVISGGELTELELRLGLALGAVVGAAEDSGRIVKTLLEERTPCRPEGLVPLLPDAATWAAFVRGASPELERWTDGQVEPAARYVHGKFCEDSGNNRKKHHESVWAWDNHLPEAYKRSNFDQVRFAILILDALGYDVVPLDGGPLPDPEKAPVPPGYEQKVLAMSELEHGRFCAERLVAGWRYGPENNVERKTNPTLVPWTSLSASDKEYDSSAVRNFPKWLAAAGLKIIPRARTT